MSQDSNHLARLQSRFRPISVPDGIEPSQWMDWRWQFKNALKTESDFAQRFALTPAERLGFSRTQNLFKIQTTPYYASLASVDRAECPVRRMLMPHALEAVRGTQQMSDPLGEIKNSPLQRIVHRYPDRVLFLVTDQCSVYCRYCLRKHFTGHDQALIRQSEYDLALKYLREHREIREVIISGGDPLTLADSVLERVLRDLRTIDHVEMIRLATRMPVVAPMRITQDLVSKLRAYHPIVVMTHFNHVNELTWTAAEALTRLVDHGFPVFNQMVLMRGINDFAEAVETLNRALLYLRVKPYYMFQCDPSEGTDHFRTTIEESMAIQRELWGRVSGLVLPNLSLDIPGGGGKVPLVPNFVKERSAEGWSFCGWDGVEGEYKNPQR